MAGWIAVAIMGILLGLLIAAAVAGRRRGYKLDQVERNEFRNIHVPSLPSEGTTPPRD